MSKQVSPLLLAGGAVAAYLLFANKTGTVPNITQPGIAVPVDATGQVPTTYGINGGYTGIHAGVVSNYAAIIAANPNVGNPYYQLSPAERSQYVANYLDIAEGLPTWPGGLSAANIQKHWQLYGPSQQRIYLPLEPPSAAPYIAPPSPPKSKGTGVFGNILRVLTVVGGGVLEVASAGTLTPIVAPATSAALAAESLIHGTNDNQLGDEELQILFTGAWVLTNILPFYNQTNKKVVKQINNTLHSLLNQYA